MRFTTIIMCLSIASTAAALDLTQLNNGSDWKKLAEQTDADGAIAKTMMDAWAFIEASKKINDVRKQAFSSQQVVSVSTTAYSVVIPGTLRVADQRVRFTTANCSPGGMRNDVYIHTTRDVPLSEVRFVQQDAQDKSSCVEMWIGDSKSPILIAGAKSIADVLGK